MKHTHTTILAAVVLMGLTIFASCKKENETKAPEARNQQCASIIHPEQIDDMNAYLKDFKLKMQTSKGEESVSIDEAAWHLSSLANYDFANANVECEDIRFDTLYSAMTITGGSVLLSDLSATYEKISTDIDKFYQCLVLENKHFRFIGVSVTDDGTVTISLTTTYGYSSKNLSDHCWYFDNEWEANVACEYYFDWDMVYYASSTGRSELERVLNLIESHQYLIGSGSARVYYTLSNEVPFYYRDYIDNYGSPNYLNSRLFASNSNLNMNIRPIICYLLDSSLGLGYDHRPQNKYILQWIVQYIIEDPFPEFNEHQRKAAYNMIVRYGDKHEITPGQGQFDY